MAISVNNVVDVSVEISSPLGVVTDFDLGLIIGKSTVINTTDRVKLYNRNNYMQAMATDGFENTDPEYLAAQAYFSQNTTSSRVLIGVQGGEETLTQAATACRNANDQFYGFCFAEATEDDDIPDVAAAVEAYTIPTVFFYATTDEKCKQTGQQETCVMGKLQAQNYDRTCGTFSTQEYFCAALLGLFSGYNTLETNSNYTLAFKQLVGASPENVSDVEYANILNYGGNVYVNMGRTRQMYMKGLVSSGKHVDEIFFIDIAKYLIQEYTLNGLVSKKAIPQTESGMNAVINFISQACNKLADMGFIADGIWNGDTIKDLSTGDSIQGGYKIMADSIASQSQQDREQRKAPPIYVCLKGAGAIESVVIRAYVNR